MQLTKFVQLLKNVEVLLLSHERFFFLKSITFQKCYLKPESFKEGRFGCTASEGQSCGFPVFTLVAHLYNCPVDTINVNLFPCIQTP